MFDKILNFFNIKREIKYVEIDWIFEEFIESDIWECNEILLELKEIIIKAKKTWIMQEFNWNAFSLEIYPEKVIIINNYNNNIWKISYIDFSEKLKNI